MQIYFQKFLKLFICQVIFFVRNAEIEKIKNIYLFFKIRVVTEISWGMEKFFEKLSINYDYSMKMVPPSIFSTVVKQFKDTSFPSIVDFSNYRCTLKLE